jgi:predicted RNase H-like HicB family nuclease
MIFVSALTEEDGGGFMARVPDLPGCMGDGETKADALADAENAIIEWISACEEMERDVPQPGGFLATVKKRREEEVALLNSLLVALRESESGFAALEDRINLVEQDVRHLIDMLQEADSWDRFEVITNSQCRKQKDMFPPLLT